MIMTNLRSKIPYLLICFFGYLLITSTARAASLSLAIDPPILIINAIPPTNATSSISIQNKGDTQITLQIQLKPFKAKGENGELTFFKEVLPIFSNVQVLDNDTPINSVTLGPKQEKSLSLNINIPQDANISDYYFSIIFTSTDSSQILSNSSANQVGIATNVLLSVGQKELPKASLEEFSTHFFFEKGPVPFTIRVKNSGTHFIKPTGEIIIKNMFGQSIGKSSLTGANILSDSTRAIPNSDYMQELRLKDVNSKAANYLDFRHPIVLWKESFLIGLYTATLNISMSDEGPIFARTLYFFAFPIQGLIVIILLIIAAIIFRKRIKLYMKKDRT